MDYLNLYTGFLRKYFPPEADQPKAEKRKLKIVFDCSNGTTGKVLKELFRKSIINNREPKLETIFINANPDGNFPGHGPNPMAPGATYQLQKAVLKQKADLGVIFDADGDRVFFVDDRGRAISPDQTGYLLLQALKPKKYIVSIISGWLLKKPQPKSSKLKAKNYVSRVGHYFFKKLMREKNIPLGLEHSGHYYFRFKSGSAAGGGNAYFDSGILAVIHIINFVSKLKTPLSEYLDTLPKYYQSGEINFKVKSEKLKVKSLKSVKKFYKKQPTFTKVSAGKGAKIIKLDGLTIEFKDWWLNLRPSNTENLLRLNVEAVSEKMLKDKLKEIKSLVISH